MIYAVKQNCLPLLNHFLPWFRQFLTFKCFHNFSYLPVDAGALSHEPSRRQWMYMVVNITSICCFPELSISGSMLGPDPHSRPVLLLPSFNSSCILPAHTERVCLSFCSSLFLPPPCLPTHPTLLLSSFSWPRLLICCLLNFSSWTYSLHLPLPGVEG